MTIDSGTDENESIIMEESCGGAYFCSVKGRLYMPFVFYFITDTFSSVPWTRLWLYACLYPKSGTTSWMQHIVNSLFLQQKRNTSQLETLHYTDMSDYTMLPCGN
jgi:hypothetical protein